MTKKTTNHILAGWEDTTLGNVTSLISRGITPAYSNEGILVINQKCIRNGNVDRTAARYTDPQVKSIKPEKYLSVYDILVCSTGVGTLGRVGQIREIRTPTTVDSHVTIVRANDKSDALYLGYFLKCSEREIEFLAEGSTGQTELARQQLINFPLSLPPLPEQKAIAAVLSSLDDKIELLRKQNETLEAIAQAIFKEWFVNFNFPDKNGKPYKDSGGKMIDSELGKIPEGWRVGRIANVIKILSGFAFKSQDFNPIGKFKLVTIKNVQSGYFESKTKDSLAEYPKKMPQYCVLSSGDILLSLTGNVGRACHVIGDNYLLNQRVAKLQSVTATDRSFAYLLFRQGAMLGNLEHISSGTAQQNLSPILTGQLELIMPTRNILDNFGSIVNPLTDKTVSNKIQIEHLARIRETLLPKLMSGQVRVKRT